MTEISQTYQAKANEWIKEKYQEIPLDPQDPDFDQEKRDAVLEFAKYLDSFAVLDDKIQILAYQKSREIDREVMMALVEEIPKEKVEEIVRSIHNKHYKHKPKNYGGSTTDTGVQS